MWGLSTGWPCCCQRARKSGLNTYGTGVVIYFQFLKFLMILYFLLGALSLPAFIFYYSGNTISSSSDLKSTLSALSLGNIGECKDVILQSLTIAGSACNSAQMINTTTASISLFCAQGTLSSIVELGQTMTTSNVACGTADGNFHFVPQTCSYSGTMTAS